MIEKLQRLGFTRYEARVYLALLEHSPVTGYELSKSSGVPASKIYPILSRLKLRNVVIQLDGEPARYVPQPPAELLGELARLYRGDIEFLEDRLFRIYQEPAAAVQYIWNLQGQQDILDKVEHLIQEAKNSLLLSIWPPEWEQLRAAIETAHRRGVKVTMIYYGEEDIPFPEVYRHGEGTHIGHQRHGRRLALCVDDQRMLIAHFPLSGTPSAAWTRNPALVRLTKDYIIHDIMTIIIQQTFGDKVKELIDRVRKKWEKGNSEE